MKFQLVAFLTVAILAPLHGAFAVINPRFSDIIYPFMESMLITKAEENMKMPHVNPYEKLTLEHIKNTIPSNFNICQNYELEEMKKECYKMTYDETSKNLERVEESIKNRAEEKAKAAAEALAAQPAPGAQSSPPIAQAVKPAQAAQTAQVPAATTVTAVTPDPSKPVH